MNRNSTRLLFLGGAVFAAGVWSARLLEDDEPRDRRCGTHPGSERQEEIADLRERLARLEEERAAHEGEMARLRRELAYETVAANTAAKTSGDDRSLAGLRLETLLEARATLGDDDLHTSLVVDQEIRRRLAANPEALDLVLERFQAAPDNHLAALLGSFPHPETERVALDMTGPGMAAETRLLAFEVLDRLDHLSAKNHDRLLEQLDYESDPEIIGAALYALPHGALEPQLRERTRSLLERLASHDDPDVRARALLVAGMGAPGDRDVHMFLRRLSDDAVAVRITAAAALRKYRGHQMTVVESALREVLSDPSQPLAVRRQAWTTLSTMPMDETTYRAWAEVKRQLDGLGEIARGDGVPAE